VPAYSSPLPFGYVRVTHPTPPPCAVAAAIASRGLAQKIGRSAPPARKAPGPKGPAPKARASSAVSEAIKKAREEKRAIARAARPKHGFRSGGGRGGSSRDKSSFPEVEIYITASMMTTQSDTGHAEQLPKEEEERSRGDEISDDKENKGQVNTTAKRLSSSPPSCHTVTTTINIASAEEPMGC
jgi:hypothetical protein